MREKSSGPARPSSERPYDSFGAAYCDLRSFALWQPLPFREVRFLDFRHLSIAPTVPLELLKSQCQMPLFFSAHITQCTDRGRRSCSAVGRAHAPESKGHWLNPQWVHTSCCWKCQDNPGCPAQVRKISDARIRVERRTGRERAQAGGSR